jgi:hypothetical protein
MSGREVEVSVHLGTGAHGRRELRLGMAPPPDPAPPGRVPRVARLAALAVKIDGLVRTGKVRDYAEAARLGRVTRARLSQVIGLLNLAPDIMEAILFLPENTCGDDAVLERDVRRIAVLDSWVAQRRVWARLRGSAAL